MFRKVRYTHLKGNSDYYPFGARTALRRRQRRHVTLLRIVGAVLCLPVAALLLRQTVFHGGQPTLPEVPQTTAAEDSPGPVPVNVRAATAEQHREDGLVHLTPSVPESAPQILPQYQDLYAQNSDLVGWLRVDSIGISYPVLQTPGDNEYYLRRGFDKLYSLSGSLFLDEQCRLESPTTANWLIYGHNMIDGSMFGRLSQFEDQTFCVEHPTFSFDTLYEEMEWQIIAVLKTEVGADEMPYYTFFDAANAEDWHKRYDAMMERALFDTGVSAEYGDQLLTLSTCGSLSTDRLAIVAKRIQ